MRARWLTGTLAYGPPGLNAVRRSPRPHGLGYMLAGLRPLSSTRSRPGLHACRPPAVEQHALTAWAACLPACGREQHCLMAAATRLRAYGAIPQFQLMKSRERRDAVQEAYADFGARFQTWLSSTAQVSRPYDRGLPF